MRVSATRVVRTREAFRQEAPSHHGVTLFLNPSLCSTSVLRGVTPPSTPGPRLCVVFDFLFPRILYLQILEALPLRVLLLLAISWHSPRLHHCHLGNVMGPSCCLPPSKGAAVTRKCKQVPGLALRSLLPILSTILLHG